jgi:hypothetical protein
MSFVYFLSVCIGTAVSFSRVEGSVRAFFEELGVKDIVFRDMPESLSAKIEFVDFDGLSKSVMADGCVCFLLQNAWFLFDLFLRLWRSLQLLLLFR